jgi:hypothetical protein
MKGHLLLWFAAAGMQAGLAQSLCDIPKLAGFGIGPPNTTDARAVLRSIAQKVPTDDKKLEPYPTRDVRVAEDNHGAAAYTCTVAEVDVQFIFYDPRYLAKITNEIGGSSWGVAFVLAHEAAHHIRFHTRRGNDWTTEQELDADFSAAVWLTRLGAKADDLRNSLNALGLSDESIAGYPTRCERIARVIRGYNEVASETNRPTEQEPVCDVCASQSTTRALYTRRPIPAGTALQRSDLIQCGVAAPTEDIPLVFDNDLQGMCVLTTMPVATRLAWNNIDVCALMHR